MHLALRTTKLRHPSLLPVAILTLVLAGCSGTPTTQAPADESAVPTEPGRVLSEVEQLLLQAESSSPLSKAEYTLLAAQRLYDNGDFLTARTQLQNVNPLMLSGDKLQRLRLLQGLTAQQLGDIDQGLSWLSQIDTPELLDQEEQRRLQNARISSYQQLGNETALLKALINATPFPPGDETQAQAQTQAHTEQIWSLLKSHNPLTVAGWAKEPANTPLEQGWYSLYVLVSSLDNDIRARSTRLNSWKRQWVEHPAQLSQPFEVAALFEATPPARKHIALLLPQSGKLKRPGQAIVEGFLAAYYSDLADNYQPTNSLQAEQPNLPRLSFFDSAAIEDLEAFYTQAKDLQIDMIIGPLSKSHLPALLDQGILGIPTLALNYAEQNNNTIDLFQFGLAAEDEARQIALQAWQDGHRIALALTPSTSWGEKIRDSFLDEWQRLGGLVGDSTRFSGSQDHSEAISSLLAVDKSEARAKRIAKYLGEKPEFEPRRRQDIDFLFLSALAEDARQIKPILAFHFAAELPVYATSQVFQGKANPAKDSDLNNIRFTETPWLLNQQAPLQSSMKTQRDDTASRFGRLYALGADAYFLTPYLNRLQAQPDSYMQGLTGRLSIDAEGRTHRTLDWARIQNGTPRPLSPSH